jgi:hypothetical protein
MARPCRAIRICSGSHDDAFLVVGLQPFPCSAGILPALFAFKFASSGSHDDAFLVVGFKTDLSLFWSNDQSNFYLDI